MMLDIIPISLHMTLQEIDTEKLSLLSEPEIIGGEKGKNFSHKTCNLTNNDRLIYFPIFFSNKVSLFFFFN